MDSTKPVGNDLISKEKVTHNTCGFVINTRRLFPFVPVRSEPALIEDDEDKEEPAPLSAPKPAAVPVAQSAIDLTAEFLHPLLNPENVANLVSGGGLLFRLSLPF